MRPSAKSSINRSYRYRSAMQIYESLRRSKGLRSLKCTKVGGYYGNPKKNFIIFDADIQAMHAAVATKYGHSFQRAKRNGIELDPGKHSTFVYFSIVHVPGAKIVFLGNITDDILTKAIKGLIKISDSQDFFIRWSSKTKPNDPRSEELSKSNSDSHSDWYSSYKAFQNSLKSWGIESLAKDMGSYSGNYRQKSGPVGKHFEIGTWVKNSDVEKVIEILWPLFQCLYRDGEKVVLQKRSSSFARHLSAYYRSTGKLKVCAMKGCSRRAKLEAAHIYPSAKGGSDHGSNGVFLCKSHHNDPSTPKQQEGQTISWQKRNLKSDAKIGTDLE